MGTAPKDPNVVFSVSCDGCASSDWLDIGARPDLFTPDRARAVGVTVPTMLARADSGESTAAGVLMMTPTAGAPPTHCWLRTGVGGSCLRRMESIGDLSTNDIDGIEETFRRLQDAEESLQERHEHVDCIGSRRAL